MARNRAAHILVVEDDPAIRSIVMEVLKDAGHTITVAINGLQALERISAALPDLVLSDIMMPVMGGLELCQQIAASSEIPVILMSSAPAPDALASGAVLFVSKPFDLDTLEAVVDCVLQSQPSAET